MKKRNQEFHSARLDFFTVKSADSGIQNSADGSREKLANTPSNNSIADAGRRQRQIG